MRTVEATTRRSFVGTKVHARNCETCNEIMTSLIKELLQLFDGLCDLALERFFKKELKPANI